MLDGPPIKMVVLGKPITYGRIFECGRSRSKAIYCKYRG